MTANPTLTYTANYTSHYNDSIAPESWERNALGRLLRKIFGGIRMTWPKVVLFALICGVYCGVINQIPLLQGTSFTDIAVTWEAWVILALVVSANCSKPLESALKCFVFFLISQPLVYLVEFPTLGQFPWHYLMNWLPMIVASFFAGFLAFYMRRQDALGLIITICAAGCIMVVGADYLSSMLKSGTFPAHILTIIFDVVAGVFVVVLYQHGKMLRIIAIAILAASCVAYVGFRTFIGHSEELTYELDSSKSWYVSEMAGDFDSCDVIDKDGKTYLMVKLSSTNGGTVGVSADEGGSVSFRAYYDSESKQWVLEKTKSIGFVVDANTAGKNALNAANENDAADAGAQGEPSPSANNGTER